MKSQIVLALAAAALLAGAMLAGIPASAALFSSSAAEGQRQPDFVDPGSGDGMERLEQRGGVERAVELPARDQLGGAEHADGSRHPGKTASDVPALRPYDYAKVNGKLLIVNPHDMMIAEVIAG